MGSTTFTRHKQVMAEIIGACLGVFRKTNRKVPIQGGGYTWKGWGEKVTKMWVGREGKTGKWVWPSRVWKEQLGPWWQSGLWEFKSKSPEVGVSPRGGLVQEGRLWLSKGPQLYLYYIFSSPGLFQREGEQWAGCFPISNSLWTLSSFPLCFISDNVLVSGTTFARDLRGRTVFTTERYSQECYCWMWREWWEVVWLFCLGCFPVGSTDQRKMAKRTMAQRPWNNCLMKGLVSPPQKHQVLLLKIPCVVISYWNHTCPPWLRLPTLKDRGMVSLIIL